jgi:hypothetical protein
LLEGKTAAEQKADEIILPDIADGIPEFGMPSTEDFVPWAVRSEVAPRSQLDGFNPSSVHPLQQRARFRVLLAKALKVSGIDFRKDH